MPNLLQQIQFNSILFILHQIITDTWRHGEDPTTTQSNNQMPPLSNASRLVVILSYIKNLIWTEMNWTECHFQAETLPVSLKYVYSLSR